LADLDLAVTVDNVGILFESADPDYSAAIQELGEPPGELPAVEGEISEGKPHSQHLDDHLLS
jgi:hypothetical protein